MAKICESVGNWLQPVMSVWACDTIKALKYVWVLTFSGTVLPQACWWTYSISCISEVKGGKGQGDRGWEFIKVRRWSRSSAWSRDGQWGFPPALAGDCRPRLLRGSLQGDRGSHRCPGRETLSLSLGEKEQGSAQLKWNNLGLVRESTEGYKKNMKITKDTDDKMFSYQII